MEISPLASYAGEGLEQYRGRTLVLPVNVDKVGMCTICNPYNRQIYDISLTSTSENQRCDKVAIFKEQCRLNTVDIEIFITILSYIWHFLKTLSTNSKLLIISPVILVSSSCINSSESHLVTISYKAHIFSFTLFTATVPNNLLYFRTSLLMVPIRRTSDLIR